MLSCVLNVPITVCANVHAQTTAVVLFETRKLTYEITRNNSAHFVLLFAGNL